MKIMGFGQFQIIFISVLRPFRLAPSSGLENELCPDDFVEAVSQVTYDLLPEKSQERYKRNFDCFMTWCEQKEINEVNEDVMVAYFSEKALTLKSSSLWSLFSTLKTCLSLRSNIDISQYFNLMAFLKKQSVGYKPTKARVFSQDEINKFLQEARDEEFLLLKVLAIMGISGGMRREELVRMSLNDLIEKDDMIIVNIPNANTNVSRNFMIRGETNLNLIKKYKNLRPHNVAHDRFFVFYAKGKCTKQPVGLHGVGGAPAKIAKFLNLENPQEFTGHTFRRTAATLMIEGGGDILNLKKLGRW